MLDRASCDVGVERVRVRKPTERVGDELRKQLAVATPPVECLLETASIDLPAPDCRAAYLAAFAHKDVAGDEPELLGLALGEVHRQEIIGVDSTPLDVLVSKVRARTDSGLRLLGEHLPELRLSHVSELSACP